jgi:YfiH family protein
VTGYIRHPLLEGAGVDHGFGQRSAAPRPDVMRPKQVHGTAVATATRSGLSHAEADAVLCREPGMTVGVITADCVPILVSTACGGAVGAIHAGWRGLAAGIVPHGVEALRTIAPTNDLLAVIGPHIGPCCYEIDEPVTDALDARFAVALASALTRTRPGHHRLALAPLVVHALAGAGIPRSNVAALSGACTACDPQRFHSFRRDGDVAGRLVHYITVAGQRAASGAG